MRSLRTCFGFSLPIALTACNAITGAGDLHVVGNDGVGGDLTTGANGVTSGAGTQTTGAGMGGANNTTTTGSGIGGASSGTSMVSTATTTSAATTTSSATTTATTAVTTAAATSSSTGGGCSPACGANEICETSTCVCSPGFVMQGGVCSAAPPGDPTTHTQAQVCAQWTAGHVVTEPNPLTASGAQCDAGTLKPGAFVDTLARINMFRWMDGLGPTTDDPTYNTDSQACANLEAWWPFMGGSPHMPPANSTCYTANGGATAGESNIAWGSGSPAQAIDQFMQDTGNETTLGHRRWIVNPPLGPVGIGYWQTGGMYGNSECLRVFGMSGGGPNPPWNSLPVAGFAPIETTTWTWSFSGSLSGIATATITMLDVTTNAPLAVTVTQLSQGYGQDCISWTPNGWTPAAGSTYQVTVAGLGGGNVVYEVKPVVCN